MRIAAFCFFAPAAFSLGLRRWLLGKESTGEALLHFGTAALWPFWTRDFMWRSRWCRR